MDRAPENLRRPAKPWALRLAAVASSVVLAGGYIWQRSHTELSVLPDTNSGVGASDSAEKDKSGVPTSPRTLLPGSKSRVMLPMTNESPTQTQPPVKAKPKTEDLEDRSLFEIEKSAAKRIAPAAKTEADVWPGAQPEPRQLPFDPSIAKPPRSRKVFLSSSKSGPVDEVFTPLLTAREIVQETVKRDVPKHLPEFFPAQWEAWRRNEFETKPASQPETKPEPKARVLLPGSKAAFPGIIKNDDR